MNRTLYLALALTASSLTYAAAPTWDTSGNGQLNGAYNFRQVMYVSDGSGNIGQEIAYFGTITFDGNGNYALSGSNTLLNTGGSLGIPANGTYSVASSGFGFLSDPLAVGQSVYFLVSRGILIGSATENPGSNSSFNNDLFIAAPATAAFNNASFNGAYTTTNFAPGIDLTYALNPDGAGHLGTVSESGYDMTGGTFSGSNFNVTYSVSSGVAVINNGGTFSAGGFLVTPEFEDVYISPDTNFIFGGSPNDYDIFVGVRNASGATTLSNSLYYEIGLDEDASQYPSDQMASIDTYYGVFNAFSGTTIGHERLLYAGSSAEGVTYTTTYPTGSYTGPANVGQLDSSSAVRYTVGTGGIRIGFGIGPWLGIEAAFPVAAQTPSGSVYIDPTGVVNTGSSAPFTAGISPGEFISLYNGVNTGSSSTPCATGAPFPTMLGGIQVMVDGIAAPIYCVGSGSTPTTVIVPYEASQYPIATIQVINGSAQSNTVTAFVYQTTPGALTFNPVGGIGFAAAEHGNYSVVTPSNPAKPGETIALYLTGLGNLFCVRSTQTGPCVPPVDGAPTNPLGDTTVANIEVDVAGFGSTSIPYTGLSPDPGLYQINFQVPVNAPAGNDALAIVGPGSYSSESLLPVGSGAQLIAGPSPNVLKRRILPRLTMPAKGTIPQ